MQLSLQLYLHASFGCRKPLAPLDLDSQIIDH